MFKAVVNKHNQDMLMRSRLVSREGHVVEMSALIGRIDCLQTRGLTMCVCL